MVPTEEPRQLISALVSSNDRLELNWGVEVANLPKPAVKVLLNLASIGLDSLVRGGILAIGAEMRDGPNGKMTEIAVRASGSRVAFDATIGTALDGTLDPAELSGRTAPAHMVHLLVAQERGTLQVAHAPDVLVLGATLPAPDLIG